MGNVAFSRPSLDSPRLKRGACTCAGAGQTKATNRPLSLFFGWQATKPRSKRTKEANGAKRGEANGERKHSGPDDGREYDCCQPFASDDDDDRRRRTTTCWRRTKRTRTTTRGAPRTATSFPRVAACAGTCFHTSHCRRGHGMRRAASLRRRLGALRDSVQLSIFR